MKGIWVELTRLEISIGLKVGGIRRLNAIFGHVPAGVSFDGDPWEADVEGACAEMAAYKAVGRYWLPRTDLTKAKGGDGGPWDVRRRSKQHYDHLIRVNDAEDRAHIMVAGCCPRFRVVGWIWGHEARRDEWWHNHGNREFAWWPPQEELHDLSELP